MPTHAGYDIDEPSSCAFCWAGAAQEEEKVQRVAACKSIDELLRGNLMRACLNGRAFCSDNVWQCLIVFLYASACQSHLLVSCISIFVNVVNEGPVVSGQWCCLRCILRLCQTFELDPTVIDGVWAWVKCELRYCWDNKHQTDPNCASLKRGTTCLRGWFGWIRPWTVDDHPGLVHYAKLQYDCGNYTLSGELLKHYRSMISQENLGQSNES